MKFLKYFFLSDLHICDGTEKDDFSQKEVGGFAKDMAFIDRMTLIKSKVDMIVGVGDIFELWQSSHNAIKNAHFIVLQWLKQYVKLLKGNHDFRTFAPQTMKFVTKSGKRVLVSHAFQNNPQMSKWYTRAFIYIVGKLEKWFPWLDNPKDHPKLSKLLPRKYHNVFKFKFHRVKGVQEDVHEYVKSFAGKFDIVIAAHSHIQESKIFFQGTPKEIMMLNCGHCTGGQFQGVLFDSNADKYELV